MAEILPLVDGISGIVFLIVAAPVALFIAWHDLKTMKIPTWSTDLLLLLFAVSGLLFLPFDVYLWRWVNVVVVLAVTIVLWSVARFGAGDGKFLVSAAPFVDPLAAPQFLLLFSAFLLAAFAAHRLIGALPGARRLAPDWQSWVRRDFPMGLAIAGAFIAYLVFQAFPGSFFELTEDVFPRLQRALLPSSM